MIQLNDIQKKYEMGDQILTVLDNIHLEIANHEFVAIMGPSGSGKSTLMNILGCLDQPSYGTYRLEGMDIFKQTQTSLAAIRNQHIGFVFQQFQLLPKLTAEMNVELPLIYAGVKKQERKERAQEALRKVGLGERMKHFPNQLSGGQKQRVAIARAIINDPSLILADEPTGALDTSSGEQVMALFEALHREGATIVVVTHEAEVADYARRVVTLRDGEIMNDGGRETCPSSTV
ncbi:putative ABC transport system ATP-binding protein [Geomicrobium halophilum]|uniref:Putative ABC transport system ATP-binding protein n=1 Tax=Geomicrobium halophilum TaxID=549000 RepID=A0A841PV51_9BACL|nr:ABC transporter ATP-binding protein [Geomicrobium halophilum]MBB6451026.1 putative ABC transport system ATP-binding protein [Geomicrobium halophilum]